MYTSMPKYGEWLKYSMPSDHGDDADRDSDPILVNIDNLIKLYESRKDLSKVHLVYYLYLAANYWQKKINKLPKNHFSIETQQRVRFTGKEGRTPAIQALVEYTRSELIRMLNVEKSEKLDEILMKEFGADNKEQEQDRGFLEKADSPGLIYLKEESERAPFKIRFRVGVAWRLFALGQRSGKATEPFDSTHGEESGGGAPPGSVHFAMNNKGRLYAGFRIERSNFFHSSLVGGESVLSAGLMRFEKGYIARVINDSGHYKPGIIQVVNLFQRLILYGVDISKIEVIRQRDREEFKGSDFQILSVKEGATFSWPDGQSDQGQSMGPPPTGPPPTGPPPTGPPPTGLPLMGPPQSNQIPTAQPLIRRKHFFIDPNAK
jgi:hypothetical protein